MRRAAADVLEACLDGIRAGRVTVDECLSAHPDEADDLRPLIEIALKIVQPPPIDLDPAFRLRARLALLEAISPVQQAAAESPLQGFWQLISPRGGLLRRRAPTAIRLAAMVTSVLLVLAAALGGGATYASQKALPGDPLYPVKITVESLQMSLATDDEAKTRAYAGCAAARVDEAQRSVNTKRPAAAGWAAERYSGCVAKAQWHLETAATSGRDVTELAGWLSEDLGRQWAALEDVAGHTSGATRVALDRAADDAGRVRKTAAAVAHGDAPKPLQPEATASAGTEQAVPPGQSGAGSGPGPGGAKVGPDPTISIPSGAASALVQMISKVQGLTTDPLTAGQNFKGLAAKLQAAEESLERGRVDSAIHELNAFLNELNGMRRSEHISGQNYDDLYARYSDLVSKLGGTPEAKLMPAIPGPAPRPADEERGKAVPGEGRGEAGHQEKNNPTPGNAEDRPSDGPRKPSPTERVDDGDGGRAGPNKGPEGGPPATGPTASPGGQGGPGEKKEGPGPEATPAPAEAPLKDRLGREAPGEGDTSRQQPAPTPVLDGSVPGQGTSGGHTEEGAHDTPTPSPTAPPPAQLPAVPEPTVGGKGPGPNTPAGSTGRGQVDSREPSAASPTPALAPPAAPPISGGKGSGIGTPEGTSGGVGDAQSPYAPAPPSVQPGAESDKSGSKEGSLPK